MTLILCAAVLLIAGNLIASRGDARRAASPYHSAEYDRGFRFVSVGSAINMLAGVLGVVGVFTLETPFIWLAVGAALLFWAREIGQRSAAMTEQERASQKFVGFGALVGITGVVFLSIGAYSLLA